MQRRVYGDFDEFADSLSGVAGRFVPTARSSGEWWIERSRIGGLDVQHLQVGGASTYAGDGVRGAVTIGLPLTDATAIRIDGQSLADNTFLLIRNEQPFTSSARQISRWVSVTVPMSAISESPLVHCADKLVAQPLPGATRTQTHRPLLDALRSVVSRVVADRDDVLIVGSPAATAAQAELLSAVARALEASTRANDKHIGRPQVSRTRVIARCLELIDASDGQPLFIDDLCRATQVSERTLRNIFQEFFGVGPMRLLKVRQLREIRSALLKGNPLTDTVTRIAARFGVWDFSLFARNYRALYGEAPSETLRRPKDGHSQYYRGDNEPGPTWIGYASRRFMPVSVPARVDLDATVAPGASDASAT